MSEHYRAGAEPDTVRQEASVPNAGPRLLLHPFATFPHHRVVIDERRT